MRYTNIESGLPHPTTPPEMKVIGTRFTERCEYYYPLIKAQSQNAGSPVDCHYIPRRQSEVLRLYRGTVHTHSSQSILDAPLDNQRLRFVAMGTTASEHTQYKAFLYRPPEDQVQRIREEWGDINWARYQPRLQECSLYFLADQADVRLRVRDTHLVKLSKGLVNVPLSLDFSLTMPAEKWREHFTLREPPLTAAEQDCMERFGAYTLLLGHVSAMLGGLAIIAGEDPRQAGGPPIMYSSNDPWQNNT